MSKQKSKPNGAPSGQYFALPKVVMECEDFRGLTPSATKVLIVLASQYNGRNNGDLAATEKMMKKWGGMSQGTITKVTRELVDRNLIIRTREHRKHASGAAPALYALTWLCINVCPGKQLEVSDTLLAPRKFG